MTPQARVQAAVELLDEIVVASRDAGPAADTLVYRYFKARRYVGSKDRRAVRQLVYDAIRLCGERPASGRAALLALCNVRPDLALLFDGSAHGPAQVEIGEPVAEAGHAPDWLLPFLAEPAREECELAALLERAPLDLRVNSLRGNGAQALTAFPDAAPVNGVSGALRLRDSLPVELSDAYAEGLVEIQDAGSQLIVHACEVKPGMTVVDLCAGAGGKTLGLAAAMEDRGRLIAADINRDRLSRLPERAERAGASIVETLLLNPGKEVAALSSLTAAADVVLVDAPCSGTGTWRRNPEARWRLTESRLEVLKREQARLLDIAATLVKPGGRLVYAVCALTDAEGKNQIEAFLERHDSWKNAGPEIEAGRKYGEGRLLTPAHDGTDGFFIAALVGL